MFVWKRPKINEKEAGVGPFKKKNEHLKKNSANGDNNYVGIIEIDRERVYIARQEGVELKAYFYQDNWTTKLEITLKK